MVNSALDNSTGLEGAFESLPSKYTSKPQDFKTAYHDCSLDHSLPTK